jgi:hypothetical protein
LSEGSAVTCLLAIDVHVDIEAVGLIHPIGSWPRARWPGLSLHVVYVQAEVPTCRGNEDVAIDFQPIVPMKMLLAMCSRNLPPLPKHSFVFLIFSCKEA